jgi:ElaB/YqjD/DUF883 family membrane-anchored ribosome-binding protein
MPQQRADYPLDYSKSGERADASHGATERLTRAADSVQEIAGKVAEQAREYGEKAQEAAKDFKSFVEKSMKEKPMGTLAAAAVIGFVLGALWKR